VGGLGVGDRATRNLTKTENKKKKKKRYNIRRVEGKSGGVNIGVVGEVQGKKRESE